MPTLVLLKRAALLATALIIAGVSIASCSGTSGPKDAVSLSEVNGLWVLPFTKTSNCASFGSVAGGTVYLALAIPPGGTNSTSSQWGFSSNTINRVATGSVILATGQITQILIHSNGAAASRLTGTISASGSFTGSLIDPAPGWQPQITISGCEYSVTGSKS